MDSYKAYVQNLTSNPDYIMQIETIKTLYSDNPRQQPLTIEALESISFENLPKTFKTLYGCEQLYVHLRRQRGFGNVEAVGREIYRFDSHLETRA